MPLGHSTIRDSCLRLGWKVVFPIGCIQGRLFYTTVWSSHRMAEIHSHFLTSCFGALDRGCNDGTGALLCALVPLPMWVPPHCLSRGHVPLGSGGCYFVRYFVRQIESARQKESASYFEEAILLICDSRQGLGERLPRFS